MPDPPSAPLCTSRIKGGGGILGPAGGRRHGTGLLFPPAIPTFCLAAFGRGNLIGPGSCKGRKPRCPIAGPGLRGIVLELRKMDLPRAPAERYKSNNRSRQRGASFTTQNGREVPLNKVPDEVPTFIRCTRLLPAFQ